VSFMHSTQTGLHELVYDIEQLCAKAGGSWGIFVENINTKEQWALNEHEQFYAASIIKLPIMSAVFSETYAKRFSLEDKLRLRQEDMVSGSVLEYMSPGIELTIQDLVSLMVIKSDSTATNMLIDLIGTNAIREVMRKTGMINSTFYNKLNVIPAEIEGRNMITASDMASHLRYIATGKIASYNTCLQMINILKKQFYHDAVPLYLPTSDPDDEVIGYPPIWEYANKTGGVSTNEHDVGILYFDQTALIISLLSKNVPGALARDTMGKIGQIIYNLYKK